MSCNLHLQSANVHLIFLRGVESPRPRFEGVDHLPEECPPMYLDCGDQEPERFASWIMGLVIHIWEFSDYLGETYKNMWQTHDFLFGKCLQVGIRWL